MDLVKFKYSIVECGNIYIGKQSQVSFDGPPDLFEQKSPDAQLLARLNSKPQPSFCQPCHQTSKSHRWIAFFPEQMRTKPMDKKIVCSIVKDNSQSK